MIANDPIAVPLYSIDDFYNFIIDHSLRNNDYIFVPNNTFKKELLSFFALNSECSIPPHIINIESIAYEEKNLFNFFRSPLNLEIIDETLAHTILNQLCKGDKCMSPKKVLEQLEELDFDKLYNLDTSSKKLGLGPAYKFVDFLRENYFFLLHHANQKVCDAIDTKLSNSKIIFFKSHESTKVENELERKLLQAIIYKEKVIKVPTLANINIDTLLYCDYNYIDTLFHSELLNSDDNHIFITNDYSLINILKTQSLDLEELELLNNNKDFFKLALMLHNYFQSKTSNNFLEILKVKVLRFSNFDLVEIEEILRKNKISFSLNEQLNEFADEFSLLDFLDKSRKPNSIGELFNLATKVIDKFGKDSLYLEYAHNIIGKTLTIFSHFKLNEDKYSGFIKKMINQVSNSIINELCNMNNILHVSDTRYQKLKNVTLINFDTEFFNKATKHNSATEDYFLYQLRLIPKIQSILTANFDGSYAQPFMSNVYISKTCYITHDFSQPLITSAPPIISLESPPKVNLSPSSIKILMLNPYLFYLKYILKIREVNEVDDELDRKNFGIILHRCLEFIDFDLEESKFIESFINLFQKISRTLLGIKANINTARVNLIGKNIYAVLQNFSNYTALKESKGSIILGALNISATADLILKMDNSVALIDYKTGTPPTKKEVISGIEPQLAIEKLIIENGGFNITSDKNEVYILKTSSSCETLEKYDIDSKTAMDGLNTLEKSFFSNNSTYFSTPDIQNSFTEKNYCGIIRKEEWIDFSE